MDTLCRCEDLTSVFPSSVELLPPDVSKRGDLGKAEEGKDKEKRWWKNVVLGFSECILAGEGRGGVCVECAGGCGGGLVGLCVWYNGRGTHIGQWKSCL